MTISTPHPSARPARFAFNPLSRPTLLLRAEGAALLATGVWGYLALEHLSE